MSTAYANLHHYPPTRITTGSKPCAECAESGKNRNARWLLIASSHQGTCAVPVCAEHIGKAWNAQGRPEYEVSDAD